MFEELRIGQNSLGKQWRDDNEELGRWVEIYNLTTLVKDFFSVSSEYNRKSLLG